MNSGGDGVLFCWKTKTVVTESVKNIEALHSFVPSKHVCADVSEWMPNMKSGARWVREHVENK
jgi:L-lactate utilization protein LutC